MEVDTITQLKFEPSFFPPLIQRTPLRFKNSPQNSHRPYLLDQVDFPPEAVHKHSLLLPKSPLLQIACTLTWLKIIAKKGPTVMIIQHVTKKKNKTTNPIIIEVLCQICTVTLKLMTSWVCKKNELEPSTTQEEKQRKPSSFYSRYFLITNFRQNLNAKRLDLQEAVTDERE